MLVNSLLTNTLSKARRNFALAFFVSIALLFLLACSFDGDTGDYESIASDKLERARVINVKDGDSVILRFENSIEKEARLFGIDAPEYNQPFGRDAKAILKKMIYKKTVVVQTRGTDRYDRAIVLLFFDNQQISVNQQMLEQGAAWVYTQFQKEKSWLDSHNKAKQESIGLWKNSTAQAPWEWRKRQQAREK